MCNNLVSLFIRFTNTLNWYDLFILLAYILLLDYLFFIIPMREMVIFEIISDALLHLIINI